MTRRVPALPLPQAERAAGLGPVRLTARQEEVLRHCIRAGYYAIPRGCTLRSLGSELGIGAVSLSLVLRRAEAKVMQAYAAAWMPERVAK